MYEQRRVPERPYTVSLSAKAEYPTYLASLAMNDGYTLGISV
jgi:hypothetical protein